MRRRIGRVLAVVAAVAVLGLGACGSDGDDEAGDLPGDSSTSTTTTVAEDEEAAAALAVWQEYLVVSQEWLDPPNPAHPRIPEFIASSALVDFRAAIAKDLAADIATKPGPGGPPKHRANVTVSTTNEVTIRDCFVDDTVGVNMKTGEPVDDAVVTRTVDATLVVEAGTWKILEISEVDRKPGVASCE